MRLTLRARLGQVSAIRIPAFSGMTTRTWPAAFPGMTTRANVLVIASLTAVAACASPGVPPGGPLDTAAPLIIAIAPDSGRIGVIPRKLIFRFNEVVSERPAGAASLDALFLISPRDGVPEVDWNREEVTVRPRRGWRRNTTYTVTMLPGMSDIRGNVRNTGAVTIFSTGSAIPQSRISGRVFNWASGSVAAKALVEAIARDDTTLVYVAAADSLGAFSFPHLAPGPYIVRGFVDDNNNRGLDSREPWDSVAVTLADIATVEVLAFVRDSAGTRITDVSIRDSVTLELTFDSPLLPAAPPTPASVTVTAPDSTKLTVVSVTSPPADTALTAAGAPAPAALRPSRPVPPRALVVKVATPLRAGIEYRVRAIDIRNLIGVMRSSERSATLPAPPAAPPASAPPPPGVAPPLADSIRR